MNQVKLKNLGTIPYKDAWDLQEELLKNAISKKKDPNKSEEVENTLLICRHPHVYTLGKSGHAENLLFRKEELEKNGIEFYNTNRGGDITYHGPGQLVAYPILDLEKFGSSIHLYLRNLEEVVIQTLQEYGIQGERLKGYTGVWIEPETYRARKICAIGVRCSRWVSIHGLALNVNTDLSYFKNIVPCGITDKGVTSISIELNREIDEDQLNEVFIQNFKEVFNVGITKAQKLSTAIK
ncbi:lipoyl(octanoyl) transferase LipB [Aequorivita xiaoshiensis]|uniref:Octanoyltransferase n=1 Tax=Aequorivita xiaoshiensis TaxID=2874476 RepID=A0A9X1R1C4_9FLAO|nr:lipoyl(octanoyl) transferase LipB [Aequorivita xiaoshiensis]MCG2430027.1 lipoyl(octanoyl) transferase LipB [Aequorivita xiaoshiensis]